MKLPEIVDEIIALSFSFTFLGIGAFLAIVGRVEELKTYAAIVSPFVGTIIAFYFTKKKGGE